MADDRGCIGCNREGIRAEIGDELLAKIEARTVELSCRAEDVRHKWGDVLPCDECGRVWLVAPAVEVSDV